MERLTNKEAAANFKENYEGLIAVGMPRSIDDERYIRLAFFENMIEPICTDCIYKDKPCDFKCFYYNDGERRVVKNNDE